MRPKALWIEDSARLELASLTGPVFFNATCHLTLAEDVTSGVERMLAEPFDVVVVDIRLPPGRDEQWAAHYRETGSSKVSAQLGLKLLRWLLGAEASIHTSPPPAWRSGSAPPSSGHAHVVRRLDQNFAVHVLLCLCL